MRVSLPREEVPGLPPAVREPERALMEREQSLRGPQPEHWLHR
jgi:hypothetical protein